MENPEGPWHEDLNEHEDLTDLDLNPLKVINCRRRIHRRNDAIRDVVEHIVGSAVEEIEKNNRNNSSLDDSDEQDSEENGAGGEDSDLSEENEDSPNEEETQLLSNLSCQFCNKLFTTKGSRRHHENIVHRKALEKGFRCLCDKVFSNTTSLKYHQLKAHGKAISCHECGKDFKDFKKFIVHRRSEQGKPELPAVVKCGKCQRVISRNKLKRHMREVHKIPVTNPNKEPARKTHSCNHCGKQFKRVVNMLRHVEETHAAAKQKGWKCGQCDKSFTLERNQKLHLKRHHSPFFKTFSCSQCEKSFKQKGSLTRHQEEKHSDSSGFPCPSCGKPFGRKTNQERHSKICKILNK